LSRDSNQIQTIIVKIIVSIIRATVMEGWRIVNNFRQDGINTRDSQDIGELLNAREMLLEALDEKFSTSTPADIKKQIQALNNKIMLKRLHRSAIRSKDIEEFRKTLEEITAEDPA
jgi:hypothetical protein